MDVSKMQDALDEICAFYKNLEKEYGIDLTEQYVRVQRVKTDIPEAVWCAEDKSSL